jgi:hypothetical protein
MEKYPKTRSASGTFIVVKNRGKFVIGTLQSWMNGSYDDAPPGIYAVSLSRGPLKSWIRSANHKEKTQ